VSFRRDRGRRDQAQRPAADGDRRLTRSRLAGSASLGALSYAEYRWFISGTAFASLGYWIQQFAIGWLVIELAARDATPNNAALYVGILGLARSVPALTFGLAGGVLADRFDRGRMLLFTRIGFALCGAALAVLSFRGPVELPALVVIAAVSSLIFAVDTPTRTAVSPMLTQPEHVFSAIGMSRALMQGSSLVGPLIGGLLVPLGDQTLLVANTVVYLFAGIGLNRLRPLPGDPAARAASTLRAIGDGLSYVRGHHALRAFMLGNVAFALFACSFVFLLPAVAHDALHAGAAELSWLVAASGLGGLAGSVLLTSMAAWPRPGLVLLGLCFAQAFALVFLGVARDLLSSIVACVLLGTLSIAYFGGTGNILLMSVPNALRGRVVALQATIYLAGTQVGTLVLGTLGAAIGISNALIAAGAVILLASLVMSRIAAIRDATPSHVSLQA
jgi:predicted MFS family arabinose efflux permease